MLYLYLIVLLNALIYIFYIHKFIKGLSKLPNEQIFNIDDSQLPSVTILVPARNEENYIERTLISLLYQDYPNDKFRIIAIDDRSKDRTGEILDSLKVNSTNVDVIHITEVPLNVSPKKNAILTAVKECKTDYILTTDGDCLHHKLWLRSMVNPIIGSTDENIGIVAGMTIFVKDKYSSAWEKTWQSMQNIDYISHSLLAAGAIGCDRGFTANGSNLLVKKELYNDTENVKSNVISGDDFFIIQQAEKAGYKIRFALNDESVVHSYPVDTIEGLVDQRARWASKTTSASRFVFVFALNTFIFYIGLILLFILAIFNQVPFKIFISLFALKIIPETIFLFYGFGRMGFELKNKYYILLQIFHIPFNLYAALKGRFLGFKWKGINYK
ncbi:MAG: glycosyltransferase [Candidatus Delongbacteria bacterium]|jgi:biofilm PGA synthesis N-glycosyltransferase PgaC|nr:glycosyltransferase [Candidatus Delongbacteria bacterium]